MHYVCTNDADVEIREDLLLVFEGEVQYLHSLILRSFAFCLFSLDKNQKFAGFRTRQKKKQFACRVERHININRS